MATVSHYFRTRGLHNEAILLERYADFVNDLATLFTDKKAIYCIYCPSPFQRQLVHLTVEALRLRSNTVTHRNIPPHSISIRIQHKYPLGRQQDEDGQRNHVIVGKNIPLTCRSRSKKKRIYYERKARCTGMSKDRRVIRPSVDL